MSSIATVSASVYGRPMRTSTIAPLLVLILAGCARAPHAVDAASMPAQVPADAFFERLQALCGRAFAGRLVAYDAADALAFAGAPVMHVRECSADEIRIPFHVGEDRSRTWIITRTADGLRLKHRHLHEDGRPDALTMYGGSSRSRHAGSAQRQEFPADAESKAMFTAADRLVSVDNVWAIEIDPGREFAYELRRPNRHFRIAFDLGGAVEAPPPPWGTER